MNQSSRALMEKAKQSFHLFASPGGGGSSGSSSSIRPGSRGGGGVTNGDQEECGSEGLKWSGTDVAVRTNTNVLIEVVSSSSSRRRRSVDGSCCAIVRVDHLLAAPASQ